MRTDGSRSYGESAGVMLARALADAGRYVFTVDDAVAAAPPGTSRARVCRLLKALSDAGWLLRLRRGLYAGTGRLPGGIDLPPFVVATALVTPSAISHWSALAHHGFTDQVPVIVTASTPRKVVTPGMRHGAQAAERCTWTAADISIRYITIVEERYRLGLESVWLDEHFRVRMTDRERTVLDLFAMPRVFGGVATGLNVLEHAADDLDVGRLVGYGVRYGVVAVAKRLGWALTATGVAEGDLAPLLAMPASSAVPLDPGMPRRGRHDRHWMVIENLGGAPASRADDEVRD